jgi:Na+/H+ antiporter NhaD/arsenite permease-like protein
MTALSLLAAAGEIPLLAVAPFVLLLLGIAVLPLTLPHWWEHNRNKLVVSVLLSLPVIAWLLLGHDHGLEWLHHSLREYVAFIALLGALFAISGGIYLKGSLAGTPIVNTAFLGVGTLIASFVGTTGASMLLIRPLLRANEKRVKKTHIVIFFIFMVSNGGGMLTPLGDPPLFLGFLRGVPFEWTFQLWKEWLLVNGVLLLLFSVWDQVVFNKEERERPGSQLEEVQQVKVPLSIEGKLNFLWLAGVIAVVYVSGRYGADISSDHDVLNLLQVGALVLLVVASFKTTHPQVRTANRFGWGPIVEVAALFVGIFVTMIPALRYLEAQGSSLGVTEPVQYFWATGLLSSFLDNAPTYLTFSSLAVGVVNAGDPTAALSADALGGLAAHPVGGGYLVAIACGAVFMGANTYIGNGPNFMVKAIAEENRVKMPSFFGYMLWSGAILIPLFVVVTFLFFR